MKKWHLDNVTAVQVGMELYQVVLRGTASLVIRVKNGVNPPPGAVKSIMGHEQFIIQPQGVVLHRG